MALTATLYNGAERRFGEPETLQATSEGVRGHRTYIVNTMDCAKALPVVPAIGTAWSLDYPTLFLASQVTRYIARKDDAAGEGGLTAVDCEYQTPTGGFLPPPMISTKYTLLSYSNETQTVYRDAGAPAVGPSLPLANGDGAGKIVGVVSAKIYTYYSVTANVAWSRFIRLTRNKPVNDAAIQTPVLLGTPTPLNFAAGQVRYEGFTPGIVNGLLEVVHDVSFAEDFLFRWSREGPDGQLEGLITSALYAPDNLAGLW